MRRLEHARETIGDCVGRRQGLRLHRHGGAHRQALRPLPGRHPADAPRGRGRAARADARLELNADATHIERTFKFPDFAGAFAFVERIAELAEAEDHHPDITFGWGYCRVVWQTHKIKGLHENDFIMAAKVNNLS
jgi:4a-hydroxytetrahydrobiopterin dehydratase